MYTASFVNAPLPLKMDLVFIYSTFIKGDQTYFDIDSRMEGTQLYPHDEKVSMKDQYVRHKCKIIQLQFAKPLKL
uniref:Uncharacterized protein n=1 Tax=Oryza punctata TaxID=4537 RepID=A0A0E0K458_ORYPU